MALRIASRFNWRETLFWTHYSLAELFDDWGESPTLNEPSRTPSTVPYHTNSRARWKRRLDFGIDNSGLKTQNRKLCIRSRSMRNSGLHRVWGTPSLSSGRLNELWRSVSPSQVGFSK